MDKFLTIVIPAYNEEERLGKTLNLFLNYYKEESIEFLVVLNGCTDNTLKIVKKFKNNYPERIDFINIEDPIGKGGAIKVGFEKAEARYIGFLDADASTGPEEFDKLIKKIDEADGVIASRWKRGSKIVGANFIREIISIGFIAFVKMLFWMPYADTQCGAKIFSKEVVKKIAPKMRINNMAVDVEILYLIKKYGYRVIEVPTVWEDNSDSSAALGSPFKLIKTSFGMLMALLKIRFKKQ